MTRYASSTSVSVEKSQAEIQRILRRYGADQFVQQWSKTSAMVGFVIDNLGVQVTLELPDRADYATTDTGRDRSAAAAEKAWEQACRSQWRALCLVVHAKLEAVAAGISTVREEFLSWVVVPGQNATVGQLLEPVMRDIADGGDPVLQLPYKPRRKR